jgi:hypothetical protein
VREVSGNLLATFIRFRPTSMRYAKLSRNRGPAYRTPVPIAAKY